MMHTFDFSLFFSSGPSIRCQQLSPYLHSVLLFPEVGNDVRARALSNCAHSAQACQFISFLASSHVYDAKGAQHPDTSSQQVARLKLRPVLILFSSISGDEGRPKHEARISRQR